jgi:hypothetical protein
MTALFPYMKRISSSESMGVGGENAEGEKKDNRRTEVGNPNWGIRFEIVHSKIGPEPVH